MAATLYDRLGCDPSDDELTLRAAYRRLAKELHPDRLINGGHDAAAAMAAVNEAWMVLSDPGRRAAYDRSIDSGSFAGAPFDSSRVTVRPPRATEWTPRPAPGARRDAWFAGVRVQMVRLTKEAAASAAWALSLKRHGHPRAVYEARIDTLIAHNLKDTEGLVKAARAAGTAPLDLALASSLVGLTKLADATERHVSVHGSDAALEALAELLDRTWDNLAHGVSHEVATALGGNPRLARRVRFR